MPIGEVVFVSEPVFSGQPNRAGPGIYHDGKIVMSVTDSEAVYAYDDNERYRRVSVNNLGRADFSCRGICVILGHFPHTKGGGLYQLHYVDKQSPMMCKIYLNVMSIVYT